MSDKPKEITRLADYTPPAHLVETIHLDVHLDETETLVASRMTLRRNPDAPTNQRAVRLDGRELELVEIRLDGAPLSTAGYTLDSEHLTLPDAPERFTLEITTRIHPETNLSLEGLYRSRGLFCTQCEAEGFRKITFYPDRPDVMARFTVRLEAERVRYPVLLSNGNLIESGALENGRHFALWEDPHPKPAYLFALVAGNLSCHEGPFTTASGRPVTLQIWVEPENAERCAHALASLEKSMRWDEERFGREYDLDRYMIVAVNDFNSGAMENKGLNIFNAVYVLADPETATDSNYEDIESVIAHEYFHNWTGNRITCRDWFQLSLKEGLTIFRDQEFSADVGSRPVERIRDVQSLRAFQFPEDAGPTAHPVRPDSYMEINNFYTTTVYNKGAEVVRMLLTLLGKETFRRGMDLYFARHDGQAVTVEAFLDAMQTASGQDLGPFSRWYRQAGTPELTIRQQHDPDAEVLEITVMQQCRAHGQSEAGEPLVIPLAMALLDRDTRAPLPLILEGESPENAPLERVLEVTRPVVTYRFKNIPRPPLASLLRGFSAPVKLNSPLSNDDLALAWGADNDPFNRWDAGQQLAMRILVEGARALPDHPFATPDSFVAAFAATLTSPDLDPAMKSLAITLPGIGVLIEAMPEADPGALFTVRESLRRRLAHDCRDTLLALHAANLTPGPYRVSGEAIGKRTLKNFMLGLLLADPDNDLAARMAADQVRQADNMTDRMGGLVPLVHTGRPEAEELLAAMEHRWRDNPLAMDKWFSIQAMAPLPDTLARVQRLMSHPAYNPRNPNRIRALVGTYCRGNLVCFHDPSGSGYRFLTELIRDLDPHNPQIAANLVGALTRWRQFEPRRREAMRQAIDTIVTLPGLSRNSYEIASKSLA
ncbi:Aminopeptidase N [Candidatus Magnetaquicoccaceae bacterium FCR-1]|uniref:Aminopeptidase N n=1 Tax=Candidatus Magnetaquiglobus chichijimensis TaxID=3141448 RepID=A0ABQ0CA56_9PROT